MDIADFNCNTRKIIVKWEWHRTRGGDTNTDFFAYEGE